MTGRDRRRRSDPRRRPLTKGLELLVDVHPDVPATLLGDRVRIQQVLLNLGSNAVKFTADGEVIIRVSMLRENTERVALRFDVIDMGIGIADADQERLFRAFSQADSSTTRKFGGTGLGLAISPTARRAHGRHTRSDQRSRRRLDLLVRAVIAGPDDPLS